MRRDEGGEAPEAMPAAGSAGAEAPHSALDSSYVDKENGRDFTEEELKELFEAADEEGEAPPPFFRSPRFRKLVAIVVAVMLCAQVAAVLPQFFSLAAIRFLTVSAQLSQSPVVQEYKKSVVVIRTDRAKGTGFVVSGDGFIVTNRHVVDGSAAPAVHFADGRRLMATVIARDAEADLALLDVEGTGYPALPLASVDSNAESALKDEPVYVIGNPLLFNGIANEGNVWGWLEDRDPPLLAIEAPIYKGNSGSPVIAKNSGQVIGVVFATSSVERDGKRHQVGLAVPVGLVVEALADAAGSGAENGS